VCWLLVWRLDTMTADAGGSRLLTMVATLLSQKSRHANTLSIADNEVRVALAAALLCTDLPGASSSESEPHEDAESRAKAVRLALRLYSHARAIILDCAEPLALEWKLSEPQIGKVRQAFPWPVT
jgi:hypothetical protein